jgi:hypothetical protein
MTPEQGTALLVAATGLIAALGVLIDQLRRLRQDLNGRLTQLVETTALAAAKEGELRGRAWEAGEHHPPENGG